jgi:hypothetical protein
MRENIHFVISSESTKPNIDPTKKVALKRAKEAVELAKQKSGEDISSVYASAVFSTDGFYLETNEVGAFGGKEIGANKVKTIKDLDEIVNHWITNADDQLLGGFKMAGSIHDRLKGTLIDTDAIVTADELSSVLVSISELAQRMKQLERIKNREWSVSAADYLFDEQFDHFGVSWCDSDAMVVAMEALANHRLWVVRLEVTNP